MITDIALKALASIRTSVALGVYFTTCGALAAEPTLTHVFPVAAQQGTTVAINLLGQHEPWPGRVWVDAPGMTFTPTPITGVFNVEIASDARVGPHLIRVYNEEGVSAPRFFVVSDKPELRESEPNNEYSAPQDLPLPATINGRLDKGGDVECLAVTLKKGQTLIAWVEAYVLASTCDPLLRIVDSSGNILGFNHDGRSLDPLLAWEAPHDGKFIVQLMAFAHPASSTVQFTGGEGCIYRLHVTADPFVRFAVPMAIPAGRKTSVHLVGHNLSTPEAEIDGSALRGGGVLRGLPIPGVTSTQPVSISDLPELIEQEPNALDTPQSLGVPFSVNGRIGHANDEDTYSFPALKGRIYELKLTGARAGSDLDAWLKIFGTDGKEIAKNDDAAGSRDPQLTWTAPADGTFLVTLGDLTHRGGESFAYRLAVTEAAPGLTATVAAHSVSIAPGKEAEIKVSVKRTHGFKQQLQLLANTLPPGISAPAVDVPEKDGDVTLKLVAAADAAPTGAPLTVVLREMEGQLEHPVRHSLVATSEDNGVPQGYSELLIESTDQLWITVTAPPAK